jgi:cytochrome o ubiquinol oxidase subunit 2
LRDEDLIRLIPGRDGRAFMAATPMNILDPQGPIGAAEKSILIDSLAIMLAIVVPTIAATFAFAWWFRASNAKARYLPEWEYSGRLELLVWSVPALVVMLLGGVTWIGAHQLDPQRPIASSQQPLEVQVVSLDWKWLFIYPGQHAASVNTLTLPAGVPVHFSLTSASVMNVFFIPQLGSMIYTMNGMTTRLNLQADKVGVLRGLSAQFSGDQFSDMSFEVRVVPLAEFSDWAAAAGKSTELLDAARYAQLAEQSTNVSSATFRLEQADLFQSIATQAIPPAAGPPASSQRGGSDASR